jgi:hypothetical protein
MLGIPAGAGTVPPPRRWRRCANDVRDPGAGRRQAGPVGVPVSGRPAAGVPVDRVGGDNRRQCLEEEAHRPVVIPPAADGSSPLRPRGPGCCGRPADLGAAVRSCAPGRALGGVAVRRAARSRATSAARGRSSLAWSSRSCSLRSSCGRRSGASRSSLVIAAATRAVAIRAASPSRELGGGQPGAFAQGAHQASCSATARPSRLIAMRLVRSSASSS